MLNKKRTKRSPYARYNKKPHQYRYPHCDHNWKHPEIIAVEDQRGVLHKFKLIACNVCNLVLDPPKPFYGTDQTALFHKAPNPCRHHVRFGDTATTEGTPRMS